MDDIQRWMVAELALVVGVVGVSLLRRDAVSQSMTIGQRVLEWILWAVLLTPWIWASCYLYDIIRGN